MAAARDRYNKRRDVRRETYVKPDPGLEISDTMQSDMDQTLAPDSFAPPRFYDPSRGTGTSSYQGLNVPLRLPDREKLAVEMVPYSLVSALEEKRSDESLISGFFWTVAGAFIGALVSYIPEVGSTNAPTDVAKVRTTIQILLAIILLLIGIYWCRLSRRIGKAKQDLLNYNRAEPPASQ